MNPSAIQVPATRGCASDLRHGDVTLRFVRIVSPPARGIAPYFHFRILAGRNDVGHINLRIGDGEHIRRVVGHVGYGIRKRFRGHRYALSACRALAPFARLLKQEILLTCDPANHASRRTLERLVGNGQGELVSVPRRDPHYLRGERAKLRFRWHPG